MQYQHDAGLDSQYSFGSFNPEEDLQEPVPPADPSAQDKTQGWGPAHPYPHHAAIPPPRMPYQQHVGWDQSYQHAPGFHGGYYASHDGLHFGAVAPMQYGYYPPYPYMAHGMEGMASTHRMPMVPGSPSQVAYPQPPPAVARDSRKLEIKPPHSKNREAKGSHQVVKSGGKSGQDKSQHSTNTGHQQQVESSSNITAQTHNAAELAVKQALQGVILDGSQAAATYSGEDKPESSSTSAATAYAERSAPAAEPAASNEGTSSSLEANTTTNSAFPGDVDTDTRTATEAAGLEAPAALVSSPPVEMTDAKYKTAGTAAEPIEHIRVASPPTTTNTEAEAVSEDSRIDAANIIPARNLETSAEEDKASASTVSEGAPSENHNSLIPDGPVVNNETGAETVESSAQRAKIEQVVPPVTPAELSPADAAPCSKYQETKPDPAATPVLPPACKPATPGAESPAAEPAAPAAKAPAPEAPTTEAAYVEPAAGSPAANEPAKTTSKAAALAPASPGPAETPPAAAATASSATANPSAPISTKQKRKNAKMKELNSDMLELFREGREDKQDALTTAEATAEAEETGNSAPAPVSAEEEDMDWEQRADDDIKELAPAAATFKQDENTKRYSRDFLLNLQHKCTEPPMGLESGEFSKGAGGSGSGFDARGRGMDRDGRMDRQSSVGRDERWGRPDARGGRGRTAPPEGLAPPDRLGGRRPSGSLDDRWTRGQALPPRTGNLTQRNMPALHKTDHRWQAGQLDTEDPEETKKQKAFKGTLNKLTPDNFDKLSKQIVEVGITRPKTLEGLIDQIFDKALIEVTFCELYANLCQFLHHVLPGFDPQEGDEECGDGTKRKITFRRLLLNKCQEEFEKGEKAMEAVEAREAKEKADQTKKSKDEKEAGEITDDERARKIADQQQAEEERKARRRALGNIQFIGHLCRQRMLTDTVIHSCIQKLLADANAPKVEDVECLCKLLATAGKMLDTEKHADLMLVYFNRIASIQELPSLESRLKFMLQDIVDLRHNKWEARRKQEGPKKIEDVHREAHAEMQRAASGPLRSGPGDRGDRGDRRGPDRRGGSDPWSNQPPAYDRGRMQMRRDEEPPRPLQRSSLTSSTDFRPQSMVGTRGAGGETGVSLRPQTGGIIISGRSSRPSTPADNNLTRTATAPPAAMDDRPARVTLSPDELSKVQRQSHGVWEDCRAYEHNTTIASINAGLSVFLKEKRQGNVTTPILLSRLILAALNTRGVPVEARLEPLQAAFLSLHASGDVSNRDLEACFSDLISGELNELKEDMPKAPELLGPFMAAFMEKGLVQLASVGKALLSGEVEQGSDDPPLVDSDAAHLLLVAVLKAMKEETAENLWRSSNLAFFKFVPSFANAEEVAQQSQLSFLKK